MYGKIKGDCPIFCNQAGKIIGEDETYYKILLPSGQAVYVRKENVELIPEPTSSPQSTLSVTDKIEIKEEVIQPTSTTTSKKKSKEEPKEDTSNVDTTEEL